MSQTGILYIVPTPVGNLEDMTYRAVRILQEADLVLAEDTRTSAVLLQHYGIRAKQLLSHHKFNEHQSAALIRDRLLGGQSVALVSDAAGALLNRSAGAAKLVGKLVIYPVEAYRNIFLLFVGVAVLGIVCAFGVPESPHIEDDDSRKY